MIDHELAQQKFVYLRRCIYRYGVIYVKSRHKVRWTRGDNKILITFSFSCIILGVDVGTKRLRGMLSFCDAAAIAIPALPSCGGK